MSRTYRKTKSKRGAPKRSQQGFTKLQESMINIPPPKREPNKYVFVHEVVKVYGCTCPPTDPKDPRWCSKGQPGAIPEMIREDILRHTLSGQPYWTVRITESGRYYLREPDREVTKTRRQIVRPTLMEQGGWDAIRARWDHEHVFRHVHKNDCGNRKRKSARRFDRREAHRRLRREGREAVRLWENEYLLGPYQTEPFNPVLDEDDWYDDEPMDYDMFMEDRCKYCGTLYCDVCVSSDYESDYDDYDPYEYEDWDHYDDLCFEDSGRSLGDILEQVQRNKPE